MLPLLSAGAGPDEDEDVPELQTHAELEKLLRRRREGQGRASPLKEFTDDLVPAHPAKSHLRGGDPPSDPRLLGRISKLSVGEIGRAHV